MTLLYTKVFIYTLVCIAVTGLTDHSESESFESFENIFDFTVGLKNESDAIIDYATKIQALFCPEQPICTAEGDRNSTDVLKTLPEMIGIGTDATRIEDVHKIVGACCLPCSCNTKTCKENGNCCLSKIFADALKNNPDMDDQNALAMLDHLEDVSEFMDENVTAVKSECVKASWLSYRDKDDLEIMDDPDIPGYFMITRCFENNASHVDVTNCQTPPGDDVTMLPVISSDTGRIYWNSYCARCNNDDRDILPWTASVKFNTDIAFFVNYSDPTVTFYPDTYTGIPEFISKTGSIVYAPPNSQEDKLCLRKNSLLTCEDFAYKPKAQPKDSWLEMACERINSPLIIESAFGRGIPFMNIFCYLCLQEYIKPSVSSQCGHGEHHDKSLLVGMSALLDFQASDSDENPLKSSDRNENPLTIASGQDKCHCNEVYDRNLHLCRHVYCPAGDFMVNCHCIQPFKMVLGMPVLLTIKVIPRAGQLETLTTGQITKYHNTLKKKLHAISENISVEPIGLLECKADAAEYYLSLVVVRSLPGHDTKEMIKPFLDYVDNKRRKIEMVIKQTTYSVRLTSRARLWTWYNPDNPLEHRVNFRDLESTVQNYTVLFETNDLAKAYRQKFQVVSPLLYCMQIRLNNTEFEEMGGQLTTLRTPRKITLSYYHHTSLSTVQVCADEYMKKSDKNVGMKVGHLKFYLYILLGFRYRALLVF